MKKLIPFIFIILFCSCGVQKRIYRHGFYTPKHAEVSAVIKKSDPKNRDVVPTASAQAQPGGAFSNTKKKVEGFSIPVAMSKPAMPQRTKEKNKTAVKVATSSTASSKNQKTVLVKTTLKKSAARTSHNKRKIDSEDVGNALLILAVVVVVVAFVLVEAGFTLPLWAGWLAAISLIGIGIAVVAEGIDMMMEACSGLSGCFWMGGR